MLANAGVPVVEIMGVDGEAVDSMVGISHRSAGRQMAEAGVALADREFYSGGSALLKGREMTAAILHRNPDLDFLYYSNDMIGAGGLLYCLANGIDVPGRDERPRGGGAILALAARGYDPAMMQRLACSQLGGANR